MIGEGSSVESGAVNVWKNNEAEVAQLREYLKRFMQPVFARPLWENAPDSLLYTPATLVSGRELPMHLGLPPAQCMVCRLLSTRSLAAMCRMRRCRMRTR